MVAPILDPFGSFWTPPVVKFDENVRFFLLQILELVFSPLLMLDSMTIFTTFGLISMLNHMLPATHGILNGAIFQNEDPFWPPPRENSIFGPNQKTMINHSSGRSRTTFYQGTGSIWACHFFYNGPLPTLISFQDNLKSNGCRSTEEVLTSLTWGITFTHMRWALDIGPPRQLASVCVTVIFYTSSVPQKSDQFPTGWQILLKKYIFWSH